MNSGMNGNEKIIITFKQKDLHFRVFVFVCLCSVATTAPDQVG